MPHVFGSQLSLFERIRYMKNETVMISNFGPKGIANLFMIGQSKIEKIRISSWLSDDLFQTMNITSVLELGTPRGIITGKIQP